MSRRGVSFAFLAFLLLALQPATAQPGPPDMSLLERAQVRFPDRLGNFARRSISSAGPGWIGASYVPVVSVPGGPLLDIFVGPDEMPLADELALTDRLIGQLHRDAAPVRDLAAPAGAPGAIGRLWRAQSAVGPVFTGVYLWRRDGWRIKIRATIPAVTGEAGWAEIERAVAAFDWGGRPNA